MADNSKTANEQITETLERAIARLGQSGPVEQVGKAHLNVGDLFEAIVEKKGLLGKLRNVGARSPGTLVALGMDLERQVLIGRGVVAGVA